MGTRSDIHKLQRRDVGIQYLLFQGDENPMNAKRMALSESVDFAIHCCFKVLIFKMDNKLVAQMLNKKEDK